MGALAFGGSDTASFIDQLSGLYQKVQFTILSPSLSEELGNILFSDVMAFLLSPKTHILYMSDS